MQDFRGRGNLLLCKMFDENCTKIKEFGPRRVPGAPLDSPLHLSDFILINLFVLVTKSEFLTLMPLNGLNFTNYPVGIFWNRITLYTEKCDSTSATLEESSAPLNVDPEIVTVSVAVLFQIDEIILVQKI